MTYPDPNRAGGGPNRRPPNGSEERTQVTSGASEEPTRVVSDRSNDPTRDLRRGMLDRLRNTPQAVRPDASGPSRLPVVGPPRGMPPRFPPPAPPRMSPPPPPPPPPPVRQQPPPSSTVGWRPAKPAGGRGRTALTVLGVLVAAVFLGLGGVALWAILNANPPDPPGTPAAELAVGDCVQIMDMSPGITVEAAVCGSSQSSFKVVGKATTVDGCVEDVDYRYTETLDGEAVAAVCLDIDWVEGDCFELGEYPIRVDCAAPPGDETVRVFETVQGSIDPELCPTRVGKPYEERNFLVCLQRLEAG